MKCRFQILVTLVTRTETMSYLIIKVTNLKRDSP